MRRNFNTTNQMKDRDIFWNASNTTKLIALVKERQNIWNYKSLDYYQNLDMLKTWTEICKILVPDFDDKSSSSQKKIIADAKNKWKGLRDGFSRNYKRYLHNHATGIATKPYAYFKELQFMTPLLVAPKNIDDFIFSGTSQADKEPERRETRRSTQRINYEEDFSTTEDEVEEVPLKKRFKSTQTSTKKPKNDKRQTELRAESPTTTCISGSAQKEDKLFLLSLLKDFNAIPENYKLDAKFDIINVLRHYRDKPSSSKESQPLYASRNTPALSTAELEQDTRASSSEDLFNVKSESNSIDIDED